MPTWEKGDVPGIFDAVSRSKWAIGSGRLPGLDSVRIQIGSTRF